MDGWLVPIYREGLVNPWFNDAGMFGRRVPFGDMGHHMAPFHAMQHNMDRMMRDVDALFPFHTPGNFRSGTSTPSALAPKQDDKTYKVQIEAKDYAPNEIITKTVQRDGHEFLVVEGKHETNDEHGYHSVHHFRRQYMLPENVNGEKLSAKLGKDGVLCVEAPKDDSKQAKAKNIPIKNA